MSDSVLKKDNGPLVPWDTIGQDRFDELVEALVPYQHPRGSRVDAIDGRGGDGGVDVAAVEPDPDTGKVVLYRDERGRLVVYQLKYFPEGFSGPFGGRRKQIKRSLNQAIKKNPDMSEWVLVAPCRLSQGDRNFVEKLREDHPDLPITLVARADLNGEAWVAGHQNLARALVTREEFMEKAAIANRESVALTNGLPDLIERQRALNGVVDDVDPHWTWRIMASPSGPEMHVLYPKHPQAPQVSPVGFTVQVTDSPQGEAFRRAMDYGTFDPVSLSKEAITRFELTGPPIVQSANHDDATELLRLELQPVVDERSPVPLALILYDERDRELRTYQGRVMGTDRGSKGFSLRHEFYDGCFTIQWRIPAAPEAQDSVSADISFDLNRTRSAAGIYGVTDLALMFEASRSIRLLTAQGEQLARLGLEAQAYDEEKRQHLMILREFADDLVYVQQEYRREFVFPDEISTMARIDLRTLRRLLEGKAVCTLHAQRLHLDLKPDALEDPTFQAFLAGPHQLVSITDGDEAVQWTIDAVRDQGELATVPLPGKYGIYFPEVVAENAAEVTEALTAGRSVRLDLHSPSQLRPRLYLPDRMGANAKITAEPWDLPGVPEVPEPREAHAAEEAGPQADD